MKPWLMIESVSLGGSAVSKPATIDPNHASVLHLINHAGLEVGFERPFLNDVISK
eukprot:CAMPEP_0181267232 /NCGR_PEP_ID=MMETSP1097-20121128/4770_1 /TAXON_ID=35684 /ORGANISM="Pseudopedinella elastica, Strain CCMP716" /LENGTH=54 /DNA_ID=CAMNT_0023366605 /DNA_START=606 /DNA_END=767 /DNA_ORIENTATION=-